MDSRCQKETVNDKFFRDLYEKYLMDTTREVTIEGKLMFFIYRQEILDKRMAKRQRRQDMAKRRTAAAQERMRIISQLARKDKRDDDFGMRDEDWDVYKVINRVCEVS